jgi:hypothetical protein
MNAQTDNLGYYLVGWKKFYNKTQALIESKKTGYDVNWNFNENVYGKINWAEPIETPLFEIYKNRAQQLRDKYDYLMLYFSGGADSAVILKTFVENNIFLDEIVMQLPDPIKHHRYDPKDTSQGNFYAEIEFSAIPYLNTLKNKINPNTKITYQDFSKPGLELLEKDNWIESVSLCTNITLSGVFRQITQSTDKHILKLNDTGKSIAQILGIDKPLVYYDGSNYYAYFMDTSTYHYVSPVDFNDIKLSAKYTTEFFYWTPDMPEIVVKQAQEIKKNCENNPVAKFMASEILIRHISEYRPIIHPIIYPHDVIMEFQAEKPSSNIIRPMDNWFWETASEKAKNNYKTAIDYLGQQINSRHLIKSSIQHGLSSHKTKFYKL